MWNRIGKLFSFANVVSLLALVVALSGSAYAVTLAKNSVGAPEIKKGAVRSPEVKNHSLRKKDFKEGQLPAGPAGPPGPQGIQGPPGVNGAAKVVYRRADTGPLNQGAFARITVGCEPGERLIGGGAGWPFVANGYHDIYQQLSSSGPGILTNPANNLARAIEEGETPDVWFASGYQAEVNPHTLTAWAICASP
jgi:hypothetical protein